MKAKHRLALALGGALALVLGAAAWQANSTAGAVALSFLGGILLRVAYDKGESEREH